MHTLFSQTNTDVIEIIENKETLQLLLLVCLFLNFLDNNKTFLSLFQNLLTKTSYQEFFWYFFHTKPFPSSNSFEFKEFLKQLLYVIITLEPRLTKSKKINLKNITI